MGENVVLGFFLTLEQKQNGCHSILTDTGDTQRSEETISADAKEEHCKLLSGLNLGWFTPGCYHFAINDRNVLCWPLLMSATPQPAAYRRCLKLKRSLSYKDIYNPS